jgi:hypothetical protein
MISQKRIFEAQLELGVSYSYIIKTSKLFMDNVRALFRNLVFQNFEILQTDSLNFALKACYWLLVYIAFY